MSVSEMTYVCIEWNVKPQLSQLINLGLPVVPQLSASTSYGRIELLPALFLGYKAICLSPLTRLFWYTVIYKCPFLTLLTVSLTVTAAADGSDDDDVDILEP